VARDTVALRNVGHGVNDLYWFVIPSMLPVILARYSLKYATAGGILTAFLCVIAVFSFVLGRFSDSVPRHQIMGAEFIFASSFLVAASLPDNLTLFVVFILTAGIGVSAYHPAGYASLDETTGRNKGTAYGWFEFWGSLAVFCMFLLHGLLLSSYDWRTIITITSIPGFLMGALYLLYSGRFRRQAAAGRESPAGDPPDRPVPEGSVPLWFFALFLAVVTFRFFGIMAVVSFTPTYLVREIGLEPSLASYATGIYFLGGLIFTPVLGRQSDLRGPFPVLLATTAAAFPLLFLLSMPAGFLILIPLYLFLIGICYYGAGPPMDLIITRVSSRLGRGEAFGYFMAMIAIAYSFSPLLFGMLADRVGLRLSIRAFSSALFAATALLGLLAALMKRRAGNHTPLSGGPPPGPAGAGVEEGTYD
jgi:MFS family permease